MKQLTCELCGSTNFVKQDGMFVCQECGTKYTVEEARNLMAEVSADAPAPAPAKPVNTAQVENLLKMAHSAFDSKNYAKAEEFCDQAIAIDSQNYDAWKLKGEAINYQINANNPRILEVYNCIMTSYRILGDDMDEITKKLKTFEIAQSLKTCMEGEVDFWLNQFEAGRPTQASYNKAINTYTDCYNKMKDAYAEFGYDSETYLKNFDNHFCAKANAVCVSAWKTTVGYNYFRKDLSNLGANWNRNPNRKEPYSDDVYRPNKNIFSTFLEETGHMINLLKYCTNKFNDLTTPITKENIYSNLEYFYRTPINQVSYKAMVSTTTNGYGAVTSRSQYFEVDTCLMDEAKKQREDFAKKYGAKKEEAIEEGKRIAKAEEEKKIAEYWAAHAEEKAAFDAEKKELQDQIDALEKELGAVPGDDEIAGLQEQINSMTAQKNSLGMFKGKEKKALQDQIDDLTAKVASVQDRVTKAKEELQAKIDPLVKRVSEIDAELTKAR